MRFFRLIMCLCFPILTQAQSFISPVADISQFAISLFDLGEGIQFTGRHPAGGGKASSLMAAVYGENNLIPGGEKYVNFSSGLPVSPGCLLFLVDYAGAGDYDELQTGIGYSRSLGEWVQIGVRFNYYRLHLAGYGSASAFPVEAGAVFKL
jgi:hypothetical protein